MSTDTDTSAPFITFCIPFYRGLAYLEETLRSVSAQSHQGWRCIVVDDGSADGADALVNSFRDSRFSYFKNTVNLGLAGNWNRCMELAQTPYVTLLHADDRLRSDYAKNMSLISEAYPNAAAIFCRAAIIDCNGMEAFSFADRFKNILMPSRREIISLKGEAGLATLMKGNFIFCPTLCYNRSKVRQPMFNDSWRMVLDLEWLTSALLDGEEIIGSPMIAYEYRRHKENQTSILTQSRLRFREEIAIHHKLALCCRRRGWAHAGAAASRMISVRLHLLYQIAECCLRFELRDAFSNCQVLITSFRDPQ